MYRRVAKRYLYAATIAIALLGCSSGPPPGPDAAAPKITAAPTQPADATPETPWTEEPQLASDAAREAVNRAQGFLEERRIEEALEALQAAVRTHPDDVALRLAWADVVAITGDIDEAVRVLQEGARKRPEDADLLDIAGRMRLQQAADGPNITRRLGSVEARPSKDKAADAAFVRKRLEEARELFRSALQVRSNHLAAMKGLASAHQALGEHAKAVEVWARVARLSPTPDAEEQLAAAVRDAGEPERAIEILEALAAKAPDRASVHAALADLYEAGGRAEKASASRRRARFYEWTAPFTVAMTDENVASVAGLASHFDRAAASKDMSEEAREKAVRNEIERLARWGTDDARSLLAAFAWHHSHDKLEEAAFESLRKMGPAAADTLLALFERASSTCTMRSAGEALARLRDPRAFELLAQALPRDQGFFPVDAAGALDVLGDPRAVPLLARIAARTIPKGDDPMMSAGAAMARGRATLALGAFATPDARSVLERLVSDADVGLEARAALYRLTKDQAHLRALEQVTGNQRDAALHLLATYIEQAGTPEATAAAKRARKAQEASRSAK